MKKLLYLPFFLIFFSLFVFAQSNGESMGGTPAAAREEIDYLLFRPDSATVFEKETEAGIQLDKVVRYLQQLDHTNHRIYVYGYTAFAANDVDAEDLSRQRALFVINELKKRGIPGNLFADPVGHGSVDLWGSNTTEENKSPNRRVRILVDGTVITPDILAESAVKPPAETPAVAAEEPVAQKEKSEFKIPAQMLIPLLLIPLFILLFLLLKNRTKKEKPAVQKVVSAVPLAAVEPAEPPTEPAKPPAPAEKTKETVNLEEEIRLCAYYFSHDHPGHCDPEGDWYCAVPKVCAEYESKGYQTYYDTSAENTAKGWWAVR